MMADSGAFVSATRDRHILSNYRKLETPIPVGTARGGDCLFLTGIGDLHGREIWLASDISERILCSGLCIQFIFHRGADHRIQFMGR